MKYLSLCSGIEAATVAWHPLGWEAVAYSEIEKFPSEVLAHHYPSTPNLGDMTKFKEWNFESDVDLLVGGTPCQSFSVAGLRKGLDDPRGNLMLTYLAIADKYRPRWLVWENVPGVLSSNGGKDFGVFLGALGELGYGFAYRILDAQYFGVAQRRRRVFVVGYLGDWRAAAAVLFERHSLQGHPAPSREARKEVTECAGAGASSSGWPADISSTLNASFGTKQGLENQHINNDCPMFVPAQAIGFESSRRDSVRLYDGISNTLQAFAGTGGGNSPMVMQPIALAENTIGRQPHNGGNGDGFTDGGPMYTLNATGVHGVAQPIPFDTTQITSPLNYSSPKAGDPCHPLAAGAHIPAIAVGTDLYNGAITGDVAVPMTNRADGTGTGPTVMQAMAVRRLTPVECERLQGFPDSYTDIKLKDKPTPDGPRYKTLGNSMAVPVMAWIGQRIQEVEAICKQNK
jgi:DNA (cytosine-5)-methyltransferase 1